MKFSILEVSALLFNVDQFTVKDGYEYHLKFECNKCERITSEFQHFNCGINQPQASEDGMNRNSYNLVYNCEHCRHVHKINVCQEYELPYKAQLSPHFQPWVVFQSRGCKPVDYHPSPHFQCVGKESGEVFHFKLDNDNSWCQFDGGAGLVVGVYSFKYRFSHFQQVKRPKLKMDAYNEDNNDGGQDEGCVST